MGFKKHNLKMQNTHWFIYVMIVFICSFTTVSCSGGDEDEEGQDTFNFDVEDVSNINWISDLFFLIDLEGTEADINVLQVGGSVTLRINNDDTFTFDITIPALPEPNITVTGSFVIDDGDLFLSFDGVPTQQPFTAFLSNDENLLRLDGGSFFIDLDGDGNFEMADLRSRYSR